MATLLEEDGIFGSYVDTCHPEQVVGICIVYFVAINPDWSCTSVADLEGVPMVHGTPFSRISCTEKCITGIARLDTQSRKACMFETVSTTYLP